MSISIKREPQPFIPVYNEAMLILDSTKKSEEGFQYIVDVNIYGTNQSRIIVQTNPQGYGVVDLHKHIEPFVTFSIDHDNTNLFQNMQSAYTKYNVSLSEEYRVYNYIISVTDSAGFCKYNFNSTHYYKIGDNITVSGSTVPAYDGVQTVSSAPSSTSVVTTKAFSANATGVALRADNATTIITGSTVFSASTYAINASLYWEDIPNWDHTLYKMDTGTTGSFLSTIPSTNDVKLGDRIWSNFYNSTSLKVAYVQITSDNGVYNIANNKTSSTDANKFLTLGVGPWNIENTTNSVTVVSGVLPIINEFTTQYTVKLLDSTSATTSETLTFNLVDNCSRFENYRMIYLDRFGSFLNVNFDLAHKKRINVKREMYQQNYGSYNPTTNYYGWNSWDRGTSQLDSKIREIYTINTDWISETIGNQVIDLIESPEVYHLTEDNFTWAYNSPILINTISNNGGYIQINTVVHGFLQGDRVLLEDFNSSYGINGVAIITSIVSTTAFVINKLYQSIVYSGTESVSQGYKTGNNGGKLYAVNINTNSLSEKQRAIDKLINYTIDFEYSNKSGVQRG